MSSDDGDDAVITITNVIDSIGIEIYKYLYSTGVVQIQSF